MIRLDFCHRRKDQSITNTFLLDFLQCHISMRQLSGKREIQSEQLQGIIGASIAKTDLEASLVTNYIHKKLMGKSLESGWQVHAMIVEDH